MDWILDNLQIIIAVAGAIAYWLNARSKEKTGEPADYDGDGKPDVNTQPQGSMREPAETFDEDYSTRRIQEEIRRKIAERNGGGEQMPPMLPSAPHAEPSNWDQEHERRRGQLAEAQRAEAQARRAEDEEEAATALERQNALASQLAALQARKAEAGREANAVWMKQPDPTSASAVGAGSRDGVGLLGELRNARSLRRAIVLREVLGAPVGLR